MTLKQTFNDFSRKPKLSPFSHALSHGCQNTQTTTALGLRPRDALGMKDTPLNP